MDKREIKFRAWNKYMKRMESWENILSHNFLSDNGFEFLIKNDDFEFLQYTGLKDKNGVEIYQGDIIEFSKGLRDVVKWIGCGFNMDIFFTDYEVIGNIYEHKHLMKKDG